MSVDTAHAERLLRDSSLPVPFAAVASSNDRASGFGDMAFWFADDKAQVMG